MRGYRSRASMFTQSNAFRTMINNNSRDWDATGAARENLSSLVSSGRVGVRGRNHVTIRRGADPSRTTIYLLDEIIRQGVSSQQRRFTMTIRGTNNDGGTSTIIRSIDPSNTEQILRIAGVMAYATSVGDDNIMVDAGAVTTDTSTSSDEEVLNYLRINDVSSITVTALPTYAPNTEETADNNLEEEEESVISGPRRSQRIASRRRLTGPGSSSGGFFRFWLDEDFPESLKHLQVFKESEHEAMVKAMTTDINGEEFELGCLAHSMISLGLPLSKIHTLFEFVSGSLNPTFPSAKLSHLAATLEINLQVSFYNKDHQTKGRTVRKYFYDPDPHGEVYYLGKIENHYINDNESNWNIKAIRYYVRNKKEGGDRFNCLPLAKQQRVIKIHRPDPHRYGVKFRFAPENEPKATNGELLSILTYGYEGYTSFSKQVGKVSSQKPFVRPMNVGDICMRAELYHIFQKDFQRRDLPDFRDDEAADNFVKRSSKSMDSKPLTYLNHPPVSYSMDFGEPHFSDAHLAYSHTPVPSYEMITNLAATSGVVKQTPWTFPYRYTTPAHIPRRGKKPSFTAHVKHKYTFVAIDSETCICEGFDNIFQSDDENDDDDGDEGEDVGEGSSSSSQPSKKKNTKRNDTRSHRPYMFAVSYLVDTWSGKPTDINDFEAMMDDPNIFQFRDESKPATFFNILMTLYGDTVRMVTHTFKGYDCAIEMTKFLGSSIFAEHDIHLLAHNARYDLNMWVKNSAVTIEEGIFKTTSRMNLAKISIPFYPNHDYWKDMRYNVNFKDAEAFDATTGLKRSVYLQCTLAATGIPLSAFAKTFDLPVEKEYMPYSFYTQDRLFFNAQYTTEVVKGKTLSFPVRDRITPINIFDEVNENGENVWQASGAPSLEDFIESLQNAGAGEVVDPSITEKERLEKLHRREFNAMMPWRYATYYCNRDAEVLLMGFLNFRFELYRMRIPINDSIENSAMSEDDWPMSKLLIEHAVSLPQYASHYFGRCGVFEGVNKFQGLLIEFMRRGVVGGKTMLGANCPMSYLSDEPIPKDEVFYDFSKDAPFTTREILQDWQIERQRMYMDKGGTLPRSPMSYLDVGSLYPAAMAEIADRYGGFPVGNPKILTFAPGTTYHLPDEVMNSHFFMTSAKIHKLNRPLLFPIVSGPASAFRSNLIDPTSHDNNQIPAMESPEDVIRSLFSKNESRLFTNHPEGAGLVFDKFTLEDIIEFHEGAIIEYRQVVYWPHRKEGGNSKIGTVIKYLYDSRAQLVKEGKTAAGNARKLTMNAGYGRFLMKPPTSNLHFIHGQEEIVRYVARHSNSVTTAELIRPDFATIERKKSVEKFSNATHLGAMILGVSKRIMNRVMVLCDKMFFRPHLQYPPMFYMDTDSIHMQEEFVIPLFKAYTKIYGDKVLVTPGSETPYSYNAKWLGRFNPDFDPVKEHTEPKAVCSIFIAKKVYMDMLNLWPLSLSEKERSFDNVVLKTYFRMKGIPESVVKGLCADYKRNEGVLNISTVFDLYQYLFMGEGFIFDLAKYSTRFDMGKNFSTSTKVGFSRSVIMDVKQVLSSLYDWVRNGWGMENFYLTRHREFMYNNVATKEFPSIRAPAAGEEAGDVCSSSIPGYDVIKQHKVEIEEKGAENFICYADVLADLRMASPTERKITSPNKWKLYDMVSSSNGGGGPSMLCDHYIGDDNDDVIIGDTADVTSPLLLTQERGDNDDDVINTTAVYHTFAGETLEPLALSPLDMSAFFDNHLLPPIPPNYPSSSSSSLSELQLNDENARLSFTEPPYPPEHQPNSTTTTSSSSSSSSSYTLHSPNSNKFLLNQAMEVDLCCECLECYSVCDNSVHQGDITKNKLILCEPCTNGTHKKE